MAAANWAMGLLMLSTMAVHLFWGADLVIAAHLTKRTQRRDILRDGAWWLGWYFILSAIFIYGVLGVVLLRRPYETVPSWFAVPCLIFTVDIILAWHFLGSASERSDHD